jgi:hypothetical protein
MGAFNRLAQQQIGSRSNRGAAFEKGWTGPFDIHIKETGSSSKEIKSPEAIEEFNSKILNWQTRLRSSLVQNIKMNGIAGYRLRRSIKPTVFYDYGEINRVGFSFLREGIFIHKGVGRGYVMEGDVVIKTSHSQGFNRHPKPWFNPVIEDYIPELEKIVYEFAENAIVNTARIQIR